MWEIKYHEKVLKEDFVALDKAILLRLKEIIQSKIQKDPVRFGKPLQYTLKNIRSLRVGDYRIGYIIKEKTLTIFIVKIGHRSIFYRELLRRIT